MSADETLESPQARELVIRVNSRLIKTTNQVKFNLFTEATMTDDLLRFRSEFPILERTTYMISNSLGAMPRGVYDSTREFCDIWATRGVCAWEEKWWEMAREVGDEIGAIMNAPPGSVSLQLNVTGCQAVVASCFDFSGPRNKI